MVQNDVKLHIFLSGNMTLHANLFAVCDTYCIGVLYPDIKQGTLCKRTKRNFASPLLLQLHPRGNADPTWTFSEKQGQISVTIPRKYSNLNPSERGLLERMASLIKHWTSSPRWVH